MISQQAVAVRTQERQRADLRISQARFAGILDIADDAIISVDATTHYPFQPGAERFLVIQLKILGQPLDLLLPLLSLRSPSIRLYKVFRKPEAGEIAADFCPPKWYRVLC